MRRDVLFVLALLALVVGLGVANGVRQARQTTAAPLRRDSTNADGANALKLWLEALEFEVSTAQLGRFELPEDVGIVLMLQPSQQVSARELTHLETWVEEGGVLLVVGNNAQASMVTGYFEFSQTFYFGAETQFVKPATLAVQRGVAWDSAEIDPPATFTTERTDFVTHLAIEQEPVIVSFQQGKGTIILSTLWEPFSNSGIQREGNAELVINLLSMTTFDGAIWFDEWHHGDRAPIIANEISGPGAWVRRTRVGQALLLTIALGYVLTIWRGRRFGRPIPLPDTNVRRAPLEYITAIANMNRRAGNRQAIVDAYRLRLKRDLGARHRIDPALPDTDYLNLLHAARPELDINAVRDLLRRLNATSISESELVTLATDVTAFLTT